jgi:hypothetical protein
MRRALATSASASSSARSSCARASRAAITSGGVPAHRAALGACTALVGAGEGLHDADRALRHEVARGSEAVRSFERHAVERQAQHRIRPLRGGHGPLARCLGNGGGRGLEAAGVRTDERGFIVVDEQCRTSADGVWAVGDCNGRGAFTHTAWNDHEIVVANLFDHDPRRIADRIPCYALFIVMRPAFSGLKWRSVR